ncbi:MAG TPA: arginine--tRNA ligase [Candidatus Omnitrophota bacterium]|nr:arginine--tRNA ligase [Candidatus Omnitrophota bacterium]
MAGYDISDNIEKTLFVSAKKYAADKFPEKGFPEGVNSVLQLTRDPEHGDLSSNIAMRLSSFLKRPPAEIAEGILGVFFEALRGSSIEPYVGTAQVKGGFINFRLSDLYYRGLLAEIMKKRENYGRVRSGLGQKVNIEYVSANPTGPLTIAHGRQAAIGDALASILEYCGYSVTREYYLNDMGNQINMLGRSLKVRYMNLGGEESPMPEDGYMGDYVIDMAMGLKDKLEKGELLKEDLTDDFFREHAVERIMEMIHRDLEDFRVRFDVWTKQSGIEKRNEVEATLQELERSGHIYSSEGARWFRSTALGDDKDRVVVKSDGSFTYLAPDMAYHRDKYSRGFDRVIDLLGPDHHGYIKRMKAAVQALGHNASSLDILIVQLVTLMRGGETVSMSTRKGEFVSLRELLDDIGSDVTRFCFLSRRLDSHLDLDVDLVKKESSDNPVFYMQYAHARIRSIQKFSGKMPLRLIFTRTRLDMLTSEPERQLMRKLGEFPFVLRSSAESLEPNRLLTYLNELARSFHSFYTACRVVSEDRSMTKSRLFLVECTRIVLANGLGVLNITLPERM